MSRGTLKPSITRHRSTDLMTAIPDNHKPILDKLMGAPVPLHAGFMQALRHAAHNLFEAAREASNPELRVDLIGFAGNGEESHDDISYYVVRTDLPPRRLGDREMFEEMPPGFHRPAHYFHAGFQAIANYVTSHSELKRPAEDSLVLVSPACKLYLPDAHLWFNPQDYLEDEDGRFENRVHILTSEDESAHAMITAYAAAGPILYGLIERIRVWKS